MQALHRPLVSLLSQNLFDDVDHVLDGFYALEVFGLKAFSDYLLKLNNHVDGIDTIEVQVFVKLCVECNFFSRNLKQFRELFF